MESVNNLIAKLTVNFKYLAQHKVCIIAKTTDHSHLPFSILPCADAGWFSSIIEFEQPDLSDRKKIIASHLEEYNPNFIEAFSRATVGQTSGEISRKIKNALKKENTLIPTDSVATLGHNLRNLSLDGNLERLIPKSKTSPMHGYKYLLEKIERLISWPYKHKETYLRLGIPGTSGILLYGPSGCGKTTICHYMASNTGLNFVHIPTSELCSKYLGRTEKNIRSLFAKAKKLKPSLLLLDDIDTIAESRQNEEAIKQRVVTTLLNEMDGIEEAKGVIVLACTNRPWKLDAAILRPGRLDSIIFVGLPDRCDRKCMFEQSGAKLSIFTTDDMEMLLDITEGFTPADINLLVSEAGITAIENKHKSISFQDIIGVIETNHYFKTCIPKPTLISRYECFGRPN
jgi:SpoVK/Ycf46/Vps4 family AAA+-type ATPase